MLFYYLKFAFISWKEGYTRNNGKKILLMASVKTSGSPLSSPEKGLFREKTRWFNNFPGKRWNEME